MPTDPKHQLNGAGVDIKTQRNPWKRSYTTRTQAWWDCAEYADDYPTLNNGSEHKTLTKKDDEDDVWDISDSLVDINPDNYMGHILKIFPKKRQKLGEEDIQKYIDQDTSHGFVRVYPPDENSLDSELVPCDLKTTAQKICLQLGHPCNALHVQYNGDIIKRVDPYMSPLSMQNEYLTSIGYTDINRIQAEGAKDTLSFQIKFYTGKPMHDYTYSRHYLASVLLVRKGKMFHQWAERLCIISGTRLLIYKDKTKNNKPAIIQLAKGSVEVVKFKEHDFCLKLTAIAHRDKAIYLSFLNEAEFAKWLRKCKKATSKLPTIVDLSSCHLEFIPETVFVNTELRTLNLRHNVIRERPLEEDIYTIGWLDDIPRFQCLRSLNLADNDLGQFPQAICMIPTLAEVNVSNNRIDEIPAEIVKLRNLQALHIHNNHLVTIPEELSHLERLQFLVLAFNNFTSVPTGMANLTELGTTQVESIIMAGNMIEKISPEVLSKLHHVRKIDLRMNRLTLPPTETVKFSQMEHLTFLDIRDNEIVDLDIRCVRTLEYLNCERNKIVNLQVNGTQLKHLQASYNHIQQITISPKPEWLGFLDVSHNNLSSLPEFLSTCFFLHKLYANNNRLRALPKRLFCDAQSLKILKVDHNILTDLPAETETVNLEEMFIQHNWLSSLPKEFLMKANKLKIFNASHNRLVSLPPPHSAEDLNKFQELYLSHNLLQDDVMNTICQYPRLKVLHLAYNNIYEVNEMLVAKLEMLIELNLSGNSLETLPDCLANFAKLTVLRAHSNRLRTLPDFSLSKSLKVLDVGSNKLLNVSVASLMDSQISLLDMSLNEQLKVSKEEISHLKNKKKVCMVDSTGQNRSLPGSQSLEADLNEDQPPWEVGLAESAGSRNKLNIAIIKKVRLGGHNDAVFAMFDGGMNHEVPKLLQKKFLEILDDELLHPKTGEKYLKYAMITAHRALKVTGQKLGASATLIHISKHFTTSGDRYMLNIANVGDTEAVLCRNNEVLLLTRSFRVGDDRSEIQRIIKSDGIITEDGKVYGSGLCTRLLGCYSLYPHVIPDPHTYSLTLGPDDRFVILANKQLWTYVTYQEAVMEIMKMHNPVLAAKKLQDLAQSYGCKENISVLVVELFLGDNNDGYNSSIGRSIDRQFNLSTVMESSEELSLPPLQLQDSLTRQKAKQSGGSPKVKPLPQRKFVKKNTPQEWESILQDRLSKNVKQYEVQSSVNEVMAPPPPSVMGNEEETDQEYDGQNWTPSSERKGRKYIKRIDNPHIGQDHYIQINGELCESTDTGSVRSVELGAKFQTDLTMPQRGYYQTNIVTAGQMGGVFDDDMGSFNPDSTSSLKLDESTGGNLTNKMQLLRLPAGLADDNISSSGSGRLHRTAHNVKYQVSCHSGSDDDVTFDKIKTLTDDVFTEGCHIENLGQSSSSSSTSTLDAETGEMPQSSLPRGRDGGRYGSTSSKISLIEPDYASIGELNLKHSSGSTLVNMSMDSLNSIGNSQVIKIEGDLEGLSSAHSEPIYAVVNKEHTKQHHPGNERVTLVILPRSPAPTQKEMKEFEEQELTFNIRDDQSDTSSLGSTSCLLLTGKSSDRISRSSGSSGSLNQKMSRSSSSVDVMTYL